MGIPLETNNKEQSGPPVRRVKRSQLPHGKVVRCAAETVNPFASVRQRLGWRRCGIEPKSGERRRLWAFVRCSLRTRCSTRQAPCERAQQELDVLILSVPPIGPKPKDSVNYPVFSFYLLMIFLFLKIFLKSKSSNDNNAFRISPQQNGCRCGDEASPGDFCLCCFRLHSSNELRRCQTQPSLCVVDFLRETK
jgi:hypothetical protein